LFIGGTANLNTVKEFIKNEDLVPVKTDDDKAIMGIWVANFSEANLNPHHELQFSIFASHTVIPSFPRHPFNAIYALMGQDVKMICHGLWNNTPNVVAYNREVLSLNALRTDSEIRKTQNKIEFVFNENITQKPIISGSIKNTASFSAALSLMSRLGIKKTLRTILAPWTSMDIVNTKGVFLNKNKAAKAFAKSDVTVFRFFDSTDEIKVEHPIYKSLNFTPQVVQYMNGCKFVYLQPEQ